MTRFHTVLARFGATFYDALALIPLGWLNLLILKYVHSPVLLALWLTLQLLVGCGYRAVMHALYGQTLGKMICRIKVLNENEGPILLWQALLRDIFFIAPNVIFTLPSIIATFNERPVSSPYGMSESQSYLLGWCFLGWLVLELVAMLANEKRRALHDFIAGTVVVHHQWNEESEDYEADTLPWSHTFELKRTQLSTILLLLLLVNIVQFTFTINAAPHSATGKAAPKASLKNETAVSNGAIKPD
jgi:uncharacterized RDD family membrane protein YckC